MEISQINNILLKAQEAFESLSIYMDMRKIKTFTILKTQMISLDIQNIFIGK